MQSINILWTSFFQPTCYVNCCEYYSMDCNFLSIEKLICYRIQLSTKDLVFILSLMNLKLLPPNIWNVRKTKFSFCLISAQMLVVAFCYFFNLFNAWINIIRPHLCLLHSNHFLSQGCNMIRNVYLFNMYSS
jgi:hypothetical protein